MKTFQDILKEHPVAAQQNTGIHTGSSDTLTRWYNMWWGSLTDTHMQLMDDGTYVVIGSRLNKSMWDHIMYSRRLFTAPNTVLPHPWYEVMMKNNLDSAPTVHNGAFAIAIARKEGIANSDILKSIEIPMASTISSPDPAACRCQCCGSVDYM